MRIPRFPAPRAPARGRRPPLAASFDVDARIGIIGAGAAGLTVARALVQRGFRHVTVLERDDRVGGKCSTFMHEGRSYELGAIMLTPLYSNVSALIKTFGIKASASASNAFIDVDRRRATLSRPAPRDEPWRRLAASCLRLGIESIRYRALREPGLVGMPPETFVPFGEWAREARITEAARLIIEPLFTAWGYGYLADAPAAYILKYLTVFSPPFSELLDSGYQGLWEAVARGLDVRRSVTVQRVRRAEQVVVETDSGSLTFDALVLTSPLDEALSFLDATADEAELGAKIAYTDYRVVAASAAGLPDHRYVMLTKYLDPATRGEVMCWHKRWKATDVYTFYAYGREGASIDETIARVAEAVRRLGGTLTSVHRAQRWRYFPHVSCQDMARGFYERLDEMQGARHTYYAGELLAMGTVETVIGQARDLVDRHFVPRPSSRADAPRAAAQ